MLTLSNIIKIPCPDNFSLISSNLTQYFYRSEYYYAGKVNLEVWRGGIAVHGAVGTGSEP